MRKVKTFVYHIWCRVTGKKPAPPEDRRKKRLTCRRCGASDVWRVQTDVGDWMAQAMVAQKKKAFECRVCLHRFYFRARRKEDWA